METTPPKFDRTMMEKLHKRRISISYVTDALFTSINRFPITLCYLLAFIIWGVIDCWCADLFYHAPTLIQNLQPALWFLTVNGILLTLAVNLWCEQTGKKVWCDRAQSIANILLFADFINIIFNYNNFSDSVWVGRCAIETALVVSVIFVPSLKKNAQRHKLMFSFSQVRNLIISGVISFIMAVAIGIIYGTITLLFGNIDIKIYISLLVIFSAGLGIIIFIGSILTYEETEFMAEDYQPAKTSIIFVRYILFPLIAVYTVILYIYGIKIIIGGTFPKGEICFMVSGLTAGVYLILFLFKALGSDDDRLTNIIVKIYPIALIPLLVMMSLAIGQRIEQYGMTVARLYVITFNIWAYLSAIYLFITKSKSINSVAISFAAIFLLTSIIPALNYTSIVHNYMKIKVVDHLEKVGFDKSQLPLSHKQFEQAKEKMNDADWEDVSSKLRYLDDYDNHSNIKDIADFHIVKDYYTYDPLFDDETDYEISKLEELQFCQGKNEIEIPSGYTKVEYISRFRYNAILSDSKIVNFQLTDNIEIPLNMDSIRILKTDTINPPLSFIIDKGQTSDSIYIVSSMDFSLDEENYNNNNRIENITVRGYLFTR